MTDHVDRPLSDLAALVDPISKRPYEIALARANAGKDEADRALHDALISGAMKGEVQSVLIMRRGAPWGGRIN